MHPRDRRAFVRLKISRPVEFTIWGRRFDGVMSDESAGGAFIETGGKFKEGQEINLSYLSPQGMQIQKKGSIVRVEKNGIAIRYQHAGYAR